MWVAIITTIATLINAITILNILMFRITVEETTMIVDTTTRQYNLDISLKGIT